MVSRKTGYKWIARDTATGAAGLAERSSRPQHSPQATAAPVAKAIVALRRQYPTWGGKKILSVLREREPTWALPAVSTANDILKRAGLVAARRRRRRPLGHVGYEGTRLTAPNQVWTADFTGQFRTGDAQRCYPLTICDGDSRFVLRCDALRAPTTLDTMDRFRRAVAEYGVPHRIRTDNGEPVAAASLGRLSRLHPLVRAMLLRRRRSDQLGMNPEPNPPRRHLYFGPVRLGRFDERAGSNRRGVEPARMRRMEAAGMVDAQNAPTMSWKNAEITFPTAPTRIVLLFHQLRNCCLCPRTELLPRSRPVNRTLIRD